MKAVIIQDFGGSEKLQLVDLPKPEPGEGEVLIRIKAAGVNPVDVKIREGLLKNRMPFELPITLGWDLSGVVERNGFGASQFEIGEEVFAYGRRTRIHQGTYAEYVTLPESFIARKPSSLDFESAAAVPLAALTAFQSILQKGKLQKGEKVIILGATGGVGSFAIQIAKVLGAKVIAVASEKNSVYAQELGADDFISYNKGQLASLVEQQFPEKFDLVFDCVGGEGLTQAYNYLKPGGRLVSILGQGNAELIEKYKIQFQYVFVEPNAKQLSQLATWIDQGKITVPIAETFKLEDVAEAHKKIETTHTRGKIILTI